MYVILKMPEKTPLRKIFEEDEKKEALEKVAEFRKYLDKEYELYELIKV